jgi:LEA14-like dessication related protein
MNATRPILRLAGSRLALAALPLLLAACAALAPEDAPKVDVVGFEPLTGQGLELRMAVKLRIVNPSNVAIDYDGVFVEMDVRGQSFASGVSNAHGSVPRFSETVISVPVTVTAMAVLRQAIGIVGGNNSTITYEMRGKLSGPVFKSHRFRSDGELKLPTALPLGGGAAW